MSQPKRLRLVSKDKRASLPRRSSEAASLSSEEVTLLEALPVAVLVTDTADHIVWAGRRVSDLFGYSPRELRGKSISTILRPEPTVVGAASSSLDLTTSSIHDLPVAGAHKDGTTFPLKAATTPLRLGSDDLKVITIQDSLDGAVSRGIDRVRSRLPSTITTGSDENLLQDTPIGYHSLDVDGRLVNVNRTWLENLGYTEAEVIGRWFGDFLSDKHVDVFRKGYVNFKTRGEAHDIELELIKKNGSPVVARFECQAVYDKDGNFVKSHCLYFDITEYKRTESLLWESEERFRLLAEVSPDAICVLREGQIVFINPAGTRLLGARKSDQLIGRRLSDFISSGAVVEIGADQSRARSFEEHRLVRIDGQTLDVELASIPLSYNGDRAVQVIARDISERKKIHESLRKSEEAYRTLVEDQTELVCRWTPDGKLRFVNEAYCRYFGKTTEELTGQTFMTLIPEADREQVQSHFKTISRDRPVETHEHRVLAPDGELHWQRWTNRAIYDDNGNLIEYLSVGRDITERKRAEQALEASEALYRSTIDSMSDLIHVVDTNLRLTLVNSTFREWGGKLGLPAEAVGLNVFDVFPFLSDTVRQEYEQVFRTGEMLITEEIHNVGGQNITSETRKIPVKERGVTVRVVTVVRDITDRRKAQEDLQYRLEFERLIMSLSSRFISVPLDQIDDNIVNSLSAIGHFTGADRCYVFLLSDDRKTMDNTHEWCAEGVAPHIDHLKGLPTEAFNYSLRTMLKGEAFHVPRVADLPDEAAAERAEFEREKIQSVICVPMMRRGEIVGFVGFDSERQEKTWTVDEIGLLKVVGEMLSTALERRQVEQELRDSEQRFRTVADFTYDWEYWLGVDGKCVYVTPSCETTTGYTAQEFAQDFGILRRIVHPDDLPVLDRHLDEENEPGRVTSIDFRITTRGGEERWINHVCQPVFAENGTYLGRRASNHDITERKYAEEALRHERDKAQTYLNVAGTMLMALDTDERVVLVNRRGSELLGYDEDRIVGTNWFDNYVPERHREPVRSLYHKMINGGDFKADYFENPVVTAQGEERMMAWYNTVLYDDSGRIKGTLSSGLDITESRRIQKVQAALFEISEATNLSQNLEELLKTIHRILGTLIDTTNFYVALYDRQKDTYTFPYIVDQYEQQLPSSPEQLKKTLTDYVRRTGLPLLADGKTDRQLEEEGEVAVVGRPSEIWLGVPLKTSDGVIGVVAVQSYTDPGLYKESDMDLMTFVSGHITMAIQRKLSDDALGESEKLHRSLVETMSEGLIVRDHEGRVTFANKKLCEMLGVSRDQITGSTLREYLDDENWSFVRQQLQDCQNGVHESLEIQWLTDDDGTVTTIVSPEAVSDADGRTIGSFAVVTDISEWKKAEDKVRQASALLRTEREALTQKNIALKEILDHIEKERQDYKQGICQDVRNALMPFLEKLNAAAGPERNRDMESLTTQLDAILARDIDVFRDRYATLTPRELEICELIKSKMSSKEISERLNLSLLTVHKHREQIRRKLGITSKGINLSTYLQSH